LRAIEKLKQQEDPNYTDPRLYRTPVSPMMQNVWRVFLELNRTRQSGMNGPAAISYQEMFAWAQLFEETLERWEWNALNTLDVCFLEEMNVAQQQKDPSKEIEIDG
jgi:hypothetical protein